jgi:putative heme iron utilization protein
MKLIVLSAAVALTGATRLSHAPAYARRASILRMEATAADKEEEEDRIGAGGRGGHNVGKQPEIPEEERELQMRVMKHQRSAARLSMAEDARSLVAYSTGYAVLSTLSSAVDGYPAGSLVSFGTDEQGLPVFCFSSMSGHTKDLLAAEDVDTTGGKAALTITAKGFEGAADGRVTLIGDVKRCDGAEVEELKLRETFKAKHPDAFWADFGDFTYFRMSNLKQVNFVGGFARAGAITPEGYLGAEIDPIQAFAAPVMGHMNADHASSTVAMVQHYIGLNQVDDAQLVQMDRLGFMVQIDRLGQTFKLRLPFPRAAEDRGDVKKLIVQMTQEAMANPDVQEHLATIEAKNTGAKTA